jgi:hypothetical protein
MRNSRLAMIMILLLGTVTISAAELAPNAHGVQIVTSSLDIHLFAPVTANPGQVIQIEMWTIFENATAPARPDLAYNNTSVGVANTTISFSVKTNVGVVPPHIHTPGGSFVTLTPFKQWVHPGAWSTNYTVPSAVGLYGVHVYANYTVHTRTTSTFYVTQAETTFSVVPASASAADLSNVSYVDYGILGLVAVAVVLGLLLLFWKRSPVKP